MGARGKASKERDEKKRKEGCLKSLSKMFPSMAFVVVQQNGRGRGLRRREA